MAEKSASKKNTPSKSTIVRFIQNSAPVGSVLAPDLSARWLENLFLSPRRRRPLKPRELVVMNRSRREVLRLHDGREIPVYLWGDEGPTVLLAHGWEGRGSQLASFVDPLREAGLRVAAFDAPAHGEADGKRMSLPEMADVIEQVAAHLGPLRAVVAHSLGAAAATIALDRDAKSVAPQRVVYLAPPENPGIYLRRAAQYLKFSNDVADRTQKRIENRFGFRFSQGRGSHLAPRIETPLLAVHDLDDREVAYRESERLVAAWPGARLMSTRGLGHNRILADPEVIAATVAFVASGEAAIAA